MVYLESIMLLARDTKLESITLLARDAKLESIMLLARDVDKNISISFVLKAYNAVNLESITLLAQDAKQNFSRQKSRPCHKRDPF